MTEASVVAVGTPQSFRQQIARALEVETEEIGWAQSATVAEELLINAFTPIDVLVLSPEVKEPDALGLAEFVGRQSPGTAIVLVRDHTWNGLLPAAMRAGIRDVVDMTQGSEELRDAVERAMAWATNLRSMGGGSTESSQPGAGPHHLGLLLEGRHRQDVPHHEPRRRDRRHHGSGHRRGRPGHGHGRRLHVLRPRAERAGRRHDGSRRRGRSRSVSARSASPFGEHLWGFGSPPDPAAEPPAGEAVGKFLRTLRADFSYVVVDASVDYSDSALVVLRPVRRDLPGHAARRGRRQAPVEGARHAAHDRAAARAVPRRAEPRRQQGRAGFDRRRARHEDHRGRHDPVEPAGSDRAEQGSPGRCWTSPTPRSRPPSGSWPHGSPNQFQVAGADAGAVRTATAP